MAMDRCPKHGIQIYSLFCVHASAEIGARRATELYLQHIVGWGWMTVCKDCARRVPEVFETHDLHDLVCGECIKEWADATGSDYLQRCQDPKPELPS